MTARRLSPTPFASRLRALAPIFFAALLLAAPQVRADDDEEKLNKLNAKLMEQYQAGKYQDALDTGKEMLKIAPNDGRTLYNMGCLSCKVGDNTKALDFLDRAVQNGFTDASQAEKDDDLAPIRNDARFRKIVARMRGESTTNTPTDSEDEDQDEDDAKRPKMPPAGAETDRDREVALITEQVISESQQGNYKKALDLAEQALKLAPKAPITNYNVACMNARLKNTNKALDYLEKSVKLGMRDVKQIETDADLDNIRDTPRFKRIMAELKGTPTPPPVRPLTPPPVAPPQPPVTPRPPVEPEELAPDQPTRPRPQRPMPPERPMPPPRPAQQMPLAANPGDWHVTLPGDYDRDEETPVVIALHPSGANMRQATERWEEAADRCNVILFTPQGNVAVGTDKYEWSQSASDCAATIHAAFQAASQEFKFDRRAIVIVGAADSANLALELAVDYPDMFSGVVAVSPRLGRSRPASMSKHALEGLRFYFVVTDDSPEEDSAKRAAKALKKAGAKCEVEDYDDLDALPRKKRLKAQENALKWVLKDAHKRAAKRRHDEEEDDD